MPATSRAQQRLFAIAEHSPDKLYERNRKLASLPKKTLHDFAVTKGLNVNRTYGGKPFKR